MRFIVKCSMEYNPVFGYSACAISACLLLLVFIKKIFHPKLLLQELSHPVLGSFIPTFDMSLMVIASNIALFMHRLGLTLWCIAVVIHILFFLSFLYYRLKNFDLNHMLPSWFVPSVGIVVAAVTGGFIHHPTFIQYIFYYGFSLYIFLLPLSVIMTCLVYISMFRINIFRIKFIPIYASFTFPLAIGANAVLRYSNFIGKNNDFWWVWHSIGIFQMWIAIAVTGWVFINIMLLLFLIFYLKYE